MLRTTKEYSFYGSAHPLSQNGRMCALDSPLPPFPTNPLSQHRNLKKKDSTSTQRRKANSNTRGTTEKKRKTFWDFGFAFHEMVVLLKIIHSGCNVQCVAVSKLLLKSKKTGSSNETSLGYWLCVSSNGIMCCSNKQKHCVIRPLHAMC